MQKRNEEKRKSIQMCHVCVCVFVCVSWRIIFIFFFFVSQRAINAKLLWCTFALFLSLSRTHTLKTKNEKNPEYQYNHKIRIEKKPQILQLSQLIWKIEKDSFFTFRVVVAVVFFKVDHGFLFPILLHFLSISISSAKISFIHSFFFVIWIEKKRNLCKFYSSQTRIQKLYHTLKYF